jgi:hypothetical protein
LIDATNPLGKGGCSNRFCNGVDRTGPQDAGSVQTLPSVCNARLDALFSNHKLIGNRPLSAICRESAAKSPNGGSAIPNLRAAA